MLLSNVSPNILGDPKVTFQKRRESLVSAQPGTVFIFPANLEMLRNPDVYYPHRQESNFYYLSGFEEPESWLVIAPKASGLGNHKMILFVRPRDPEKELWDGPRYGVEGALSVFGADEAYTLDQFPKKLLELIQGAEQIGYRVGTAEARDRVVLGVLEDMRRNQGRAGKSVLPIYDPLETVAELRLYKSPEEIALLRKACEISATAHVAAMKEVRPGMNEYEIEALIDYTFRKNGCARVGYGSIVAGGKNATCLHYNKNNEALQDAQLLLVDAGGEYGYYTADITRTFPIGRGFTPEQAQLYDLVLKAQKEVIQIAKPGLLWTALHKKACEVLVDGLLSLGFLKGKAEDILKSGEFRKYYPHGTGHWLGMDVHDAGLYTKNGEYRKLTAGMVFTVEPGLYVQPSDISVPEKYRGIGIRIEDNILVTPSGVENLTDRAPKERADLEHIK